MTNEVENAEVNAQTTAKKINRRGVSNKTKAVANLKFHEKDAAPNGLFVGHLDSVSVEWSESKEDAKQFTGLKVPRVLLHFASNQKNVSEQRHVYQNINPVESNVDTIPGGNEEWKVNNVFNWMKHILDIYYLKGREMTEREEEALTLPFEDYTESGEYVSVEPEDVLAGYRFVFDNFSAMMNGTFDLKEGEIAKSCYKTADGKIIPAWLKLLRHKKVKGSWRDVAQNGELGFDSFIGNGVVELLKKDQAPIVLRLDLSKESITPKETNKTPNIGIPGIGAPMAGGIPSGMPTGMPMGGYDAGMPDVNGDMPF